MKAVQTWKDANVKKVQSELQLLMWQAEQNLQDDKCRPDSKIIRIISADEETEEQLQKVVGGDCEQIDYTAAVERLRMAKED